ncbi:hypothetical protein [Streptomyces albipurpureus]|uniref:Uncharacterized protein n=1 Tax=Streptomyces albipurpureus TaxID=2897419 RepID=A0ABT0UP44_9ACTN|nr:hypothetical protein [Streptomyces sp. CWNU-1]MCM2389021.1 hypothetical protein [Streptomyces sp. CWNU-1]
MSQQYPGPEQTQPGQVPYPYQAPQQPKKRMSGLAIAGISVGSVLAFILMLAVIGQAAEDDDSKGTVASGSTVIKETATVTVTAPGPTATVTVTAKPAEPKKAVQSTKAEQSTKAAPKPAKKSVKSKEYADGDYVVGEDIPAGTYSSKGATPGLFELCTITTDPTSDSKFPQLKTANAKERIIITLSKADGVVTIQGCEPLTRR